jgi:ArsR family transcriptional regulator
MDIIEINKVLSNKTRINILNWLKNVEENFPPNKELGHYEYGACVQYIREKANLSQSTISHYLSMMEKAGLITSTRWGKWTYYKRNEENIKMYVEFLKNEL